MSQITIKEHTKYSKDPILFMKERWLGFDAFDNMKCHYIEPFEYQLEFIRNIHNIDNNFIIKTRQMHISSMMAFYISWYVLFNSDKQVMVISHSLDSSKKILEQIRTILQFYSVEDMFHWEDDFVKNSSTELILKNGCRIKVCAPLADAGRGYAIDFLYIDEAACIKNFEHLYMSVRMCLYGKKDSKMVIASTPKDNSFFNKLFINTNSDESYHTMRLHWSSHPFYSKEIAEDRDRESPFQYTSPWFDDLVKNRYRGCVSQIEQELECVVRYQEETNKNKTISLRVDGEFYKKIQDRLRSGESSSDYIRSLIEKDLKFFL